MVIQERPYLMEVQLKRDSISNLDTYPFSIPAIRELDSMEFHPDVTFFVGENGSGKSTFLEAIAIAQGFNPEGGTKGSLFATKGTHSQLYEHLKSIKSFKQPRDGYFLRAESFYNLASYMDEVGYLEGYGGKSFHFQSHGESFMATLTNKLRGNGLYLMDEPEAALSPLKQMAALSTMHQLVKKNSQFIIATHSPILLAYPRAKIYQFCETGIYEIDYEDTEHYSATRDFLNHKDQMLKVLMDD